MFQSRHEKWLESEIADLKKRHDSQLTDLKLAHQAEMDRLLAENIRLQTEVNSVRLSQGQVGTLPEKEELRQPTDPDMMPVFTGTSWEKVQQRERWLESPAGKRWMKKNWDETAVPEQKETSSATS